MSRHLILSYLTCLLSASTWWDPLPSHIHLAMCSWPVGPTIRWNIICGSECSVCWIQRTWCAACGCVRRGIDGDMTANCGRPLTSVDVGFVRPILSALSDVSQSHSTSAGQTSVIVSWHGSSSDCRTCASSDWREIPGRQCRLYVDVDAHC